MSRLARDKECCGRCEKFTIKDYPEQAAHGVGRCSVEWEPSIKPFVVWSNRPCVLFDPAANMGRREQFIRKQEDREASAACEASAGGTNGAIPLPSSQPINANGAKAR